MNRRLVLGLMTLLFTLPLSVRAEAPSEGFDYELVSPAVPTNLDAGKVQVVELFWYGCPHCYAFEPNMQAWLKRKPENVEFVRIPALFRSDRWELHAKAFYAAEVMGIEQKMTPIIFEAIHQQHNGLKDKDELADLFEQNGVDRKAFLEALDSFAVTLKVNRAKDLTARYGIDGVPAVIVDGKYRITTTLARTNDNMVSIVDALIGQQSNK